MQIQQLVLEKRTIDKMIQNAVDGRAQSNSDEAEDDESSTLLSMSEYQSNDDSHGRLIIDQCEIILEQSNENDEGDSDNQGSSSDVEELPRRIISILDEGTEHFDIEEHSES